MTQQTWSIDAVRRRPRRRGGHHVAAPAEEYWVCYGRPGNFVTYVRNVLLLMPCSGSACSSFWLASPGWRSFSVRPSRPPRSRPLAFLGTFGTIGLATGCCFLPMYGIPTAIFFWSTAPSRNDPSATPSPWVRRCHDDHGEPGRGAGGAAALGHDQQPQLRAFMALEHTLAFGPDLLSPGLGDNYDAPLSVVFRRYRLRKASCAKAVPSTVRPFVAPSTRPSTTASRSAMRLCSWSCRSRSPRASVRWPTGSLRESPSGGPESTGGTAPPFAPVRRSGDAAEPAATPAPNRNDADLPLLLSLPGREEGLVPGLPARRPGSAGRGRSPSRPVGRSSKPVSQQRSKAVVATPQGDTLFDCEPYGLKPRSSRTLRGPASGERNVADSDSPPLPHWRRWSASDSAGQGGWTGRESEGERHRRCSGQEPAYRPRVPSHIIPDTAPSTA